MFFYCTMLSPVILHRFLHERICQNGASASHLSSVELACSGKIKNGSETDYVDLHFVRINYTETEQDHWMPTQPDLGL